MSGDAQLDAMLAFAPPAVNDDSVANADDFEAVLVGDVVLDGLVAIAAAQPAPRKMPQRGSEHARHARHGKAMKRARTDLIEAHRAVEQSEFRVSVVAATASSSLLAIGKSARVLSPQQHAERCAKLQKLGTVQFSHPPT